MQAMRQAIPRTAQVQICLQATRSTSASVSGLTNRTLGKFDLMERVVTISGGPAMYLDRREELCGTWMFVELGAAHLLQGCVIGLWEELNAWAMQECKAQNAKMK